jgi:hypothetical protein
MYFDTITNVNELKTKYHEYVKTMHPDRGGHLHTFQQMQAEYENKLKDMLSGANEHKGWLTQEEIKQLGQMLAEFLKQNRPSIWKMVRNVTTQPLAAGLFEQFAPKHVREYVKLLGLVD